MNNLLDPAAFQVFLDETQQLSIRMLDDEQLYQGVRISLLFPITDRNSYIQFTDADENEIGILRSIDQLHQESKAIVVSEINKAYFIPVITRIFEIESQFGADVWNVETEKGMREFEVVGKRRNIRYITNDHVVIKDIDGNRYEIPSVANLEPASRKMLQREV